VVGAAYQQLPTEIPQAPVVHTDDTGRWGSAQLMVFTTPQITAYQVRPQHRNEEVREVIGDHFAGMLEADRGNSHDAEELDRVKQKKCLGILSGIRRRSSRARPDGRSTSSPRPVLLHLLDPGSP